MLAVIYGSFQFMGQNRFAYEALEAHIQGKNEYVNLKDKSNEE